MKRRNREIDEWKLLIFGEKPSGISIGENVSEYLTKLLPRLARIFHGNEKHKITRI